MSRRGSAQLLLLFFRSRARAGGRWHAGVLVVAGMLQAGDGLHLLARTGLAQVLRQSAWQQALAGLPEQAALALGRHDDRNGAKVPRLGLSAAIQGCGRSSRPRPWGRARKSADTALSEVAIGDSITVTSADGSSRVYSVTRRNVVDTHLSETDAPKNDAEAALVTCLPLDPCWRVRSG